jgi:Tfp pilus assembly protein PilX
MKGQTMNNIRQLRQQQRGIVSIMMTIVMILVISLIVLGLAQISRREQRKSTDNQLSSQAFYAAESGVNDVAALIQANPGASYNKPNCDSTGASAIYNSLTPTIDSTSGVSYTCVIVDPSPDGVDAPVDSSPRVYSLASSVAVSSFTFKWGPGEGLSSDASGCATSAISSSTNTGLFPPASSWSCHFAVLRVDLVNAGGVLTRSSLISNSRTFFLVPNRTGNTSSGSTLIQGATCSAGICSATVSVPAGDSYYARVSGIYLDSTAKICAGACDGSVKFTDYVTIDVTGKAQDVLRRIKVTKDLSGGNQNGKASAAIMSGDSICKRFKVSAGGAAINDYAGFTGCP